MFMVNWFYDTLAALGKFIFCWSDSVFFFLGFYPEFALLSSNGTEEEISNFVYPFSLK